MNHSGREVISLHLGQAGIQMGASLWEQYCKEHKIGLDGVRNEKRYRMMERIRKDTSNNWEPVPFDEYEKKNGYKFYEELHKEQRIKNNNTQKNQNNQNSSNINKKSNQQSSNNNNNNDDDNKNNNDEIIDDQNFNKPKNPILKKRKSKAELTEEILNPSKTVIYKRILESNVFFGYNPQNDSHCPRSIMVDLEPNVIDDVLNSAFGTLFNHSLCLKGSEDAANNYARGRYTVGVEIQDKVIEATRKQVEACDHCQAFLFNMAVAGGTGSGFGGLFAEYLTTEYKKIPKISFAIYPSLNLSTAVVEPYNGLLATHDLIEHNNVTIILDNEAGYDICQQKLNFPKPSYFNINRLIGKVASSITSGIRFQGQQQFTVSDLQTNLVPYPRLHFMTCGLGPILRDNSKHDTITESYITDVAFRMDHMFTKYHDWDPDTDKYMGISVNYRGLCSPTKANTAIQELKNSNKVQLVDWCPTGFKISMIERMPSFLGDDGLQPTDKMCVMIGNNTAVVRPLQQRICRKYDLMYSQRSFVHWYVGEGMEEGEFAEAREDLEMLIKDYSESLNEPDSDRVGENNDDDDDEE